MPGNMATTGSFVEMRSERQERLEESLLRWKQRLESRTLSIMMKMSSWPIPMRNTNPVSSNEKHFEIAHAPVFVSLPNYLHPQRCSGQDHGRT